MVAIRTPTPLVPLLLLVLSSMVSAQLDVPKGGRRIRPGAKPPVEVPSRGQGDLAPLPAGEEAPPVLDLPSSSGAGGFGSGLAGEARPGPSAGVPDSPSARILGEVARAPGLRSPSLGRAVSSLIELGEPGLMAAREGLGSDNAATVVVSARVMALAGDEADRRRIAARIAGSPPKGAGTAALSALMKADPVLASPAFLAGLLDHPDGSLRRAVHRLLVGDVGVRHLPLLARSLTSDRTDTRQRALELVAGIHDPAVMHLLLARLGDDSARVAGTASGFLVSHPDRRIPRELLRKAFAGTGKTRPRDYALITLVKREEVEGRALIQLREVPGLLLRLRVADPFTSGAAATALAGIGFRSPSSADTAWLDLEVPHALVRIVSGAVFHPDFSSLRGPAEVRLTTLTGQAFGSDGPAWRGWWAGVADNFRAHRAVLQIAPGDVADLLVSVRAERGGALVLAGPQAGDVSSWGTAGATDRVVFLTSEECEALSDVLREEGVFGPRRLPSPLWSGAGRGSELSIEIADQGKTFHFPLASAVGTSPFSAWPGWAQRIAAAVQALEQSNRWQFYRDPEQHADQRALWDAEFAWWAMEKGERARSQRLKEAMLVHIEGIPSVERLVPLHDLDQLVHARDLAVPGDFSRLVALLAEEPAPGEAARLILNVALFAGRSTSRQERESGIASDLASTLLDALVDGPGVENSGLAARVIQSGGEESLRRARSDARAVIRALATEILAERSSVDALVAMLEDEDEGVEAAAVEALGRIGPEAGPIAAGAVLTRARYGAAEVRAAALRALGRVGGESNGREVLELLVLTIAEPDYRLQRAAADGMADLADPASAPIQASLFLRGKTSPLFVSARRGLPLLGARGIEELLRIAHSTARDARRDAALLLSELGRPEAGSLLIEILTITPTDARVAGELCVLTGVDFRAEGDPASAWWAWWDMAVHDDSLAWFRAGLARAGCDTPKEADLDGDGTPEGQRALIAIMGRPEPQLAHLVERARRELGRLLGREPGALPPRGALRDQWLRALLPPEHLPAATGETVSGAQNSSR